jgi:rhamnosyltransferase
MAKASVVVRTLDSEKTLGRVLEGVFSQRFSEPELVVVDSGSTDATLEIAGRYPHVFVDYSGGEFSYGGALNAGIAASSGEYAVCLSHHCVPLHEGWLGSLVGALETEETLAGAWGPLLFDVEDYLVGRNGTERIDLQEFYRAPNRGLQNPNSIIRRRLWEELPFSEDIERCEDQVWIHHFLKRGYGSAVVYGSQVLYAAEFGAYGYARGNYKNSLMLDRLFGYRGWEVSSGELARRSWRLFGEVVLGRKSPRTAKLAVSSMAGRWAAGRKLRGKASRKASD